MSRTASRRLLAQSPLTLLPESAPTSRLPVRCQRHFSNTTRRKAEDDDTKPPPSEPQSAEPTSRPYSFPSVSRSRPSPPSSPPPSPSLHPKASAGGNSLTSLTGLFSKMIDQNNQSRSPRYSRQPNVIDTWNLSSDGNADGNLIPDQKDFKETAHQLHIYATRHNVHITLARPPGWLNKSTGTVSKDRTVAISMAAGNLGFRHSARKHYDSAFQLASWVMKIMGERGITREVQQLEVFLRGFGAGREAVTKALLGTEGASLRGKIVKVSDATRLKFGGTRSKKPRRLG